jgi:hypothetical protein
MFSADHERFALFVVQDRNALIVLILRGGGRISQMLDLDVTLILLGEHVHSRLVLLTTDIHLGIVTEWLTVLWLGGFQDDNGCVQASSRSSHRVGALCSPPATNHLHILIGSTGEGCCCQQFQCQLTSRRYRDNH